MGRRRAGTGQGDGADSGADGPHDAQDGDAAETVPFHRKNPEGKRAGLAKARGVALATDPHAYARSKAERAQLRRDAFVTAFTGEAMGNAARAAQLAGYHAADPAQLAAVGNRLLKRTDVQQAIERRMEQHGMTTDAILSQLWDLAHANMADYAHLVGLTDPQEIRHAMARCAAQKTSQRIKRLVPTKYGLSVELADRAQVLTTLGRHFALWRDRVEVSHTTPTVDADALRRALADPERARMLCEAERLTQLALQGVQDAPQSLPSPQDVESIHPTTPSDPGACQGPSVASESTESQGPLLDASYRELPSSEPPSDVE